MTDFDFALRWADPLAARLEASLPLGPKARQLPVRALLVGIFLAQTRRRSAFLTAITAVLNDLSGSEKNRLGITRPVSYRVVESLFSKVAALHDPIPTSSLNRRARRKRPLERSVAAARTEALQVLSLDMLESSIPDVYRSHGTFAVDWTDVPAWTRPPRRNGRVADPSAAWGRRRSRTPGSTDELFFGHLEQAVTMVHDERGLPTPELVRSVTFTAADVHQPPLSLWSLQEVAARVQRAGGGPRDLLADSAYAYTDGWSMAARALGFSLIADLHPNLLGRRGQEQGALRVDDVLLCPATPAPLIDLVRPARNASDQEWETYFKRAAEREKYAMATHGRPDTQGYQRMRCPAEVGKVRCPLKPKSMSGALSKPKVQSTPATPHPTCCSQATMTVSPVVLEKRQQKHRYYSREWIASYERRSAVERSFAAVKDPARIDLGRGHIRVIGLAKVAILRAIGYVVANYRTLLAFERRRVDPSRHRRRPRRSKHFVEAVASIRPVALTRSAPSSSSP